MVMKKIEKLYGEELAGLLSEGMDWIACYSRYPPSQKTENVYNPTQAVIAAAFHALQREDVEAFLKIHRIENLSYFQYPYMKSWLKEDHKFSKKIVVRCLTTLAWLVVEEILSPQSPFVAAVTGLEERYNLCGVFVQAVIFCSKRNCKVAQPEEKKAPETKSASTQTSLEIIETTPELGTHIENVDSFIPTEPEVLHDEMEMEKITEQIEDRNQEKSSLASTDTCLEVIKTATEMVGEESRNDEVTHLEADVDLKRIKMIKILELDRAGIKPNNISVKTLLQFAVERESAATVDRMMKLCEDIKSEDKSISVLLNLAVKRKCVRVIKTLLWHGLDTQFLDEEGNAPLHIAAASNHLKIVRMLTHAGADVNQVNESGLLPLHLTSDPGIIRDLLEKGTDVNAKTPAGETALHLAVWNGNTEAVKALLRFGVKCNRKMREVLSERRAILIERFRRRRESFHNADISKQLETVMEDSEEEGNGAEEIGNKTEAVSNSPELCAIPQLINGCIVTSEELAKEINKDGPIHQAATEGRLEEVMKLLDEGVDIDTKGFGGYTALQYAAKYGHLTLVQSLLQRGADMNLGNAWNWTPLHHAAHYSRYDITEFLIDAGANTQLVDTVYGKTPLSWATCNFKIIKLFNSKGIFN